MPKQTPPERPFDMASQMRLFKAGVFGKAVTVWSEAKQPPHSYPPTQLMYDQETPLIITLDSDDIEGQLLFAGGYICGWHESMGGHLSDLNVWLQRHEIDNSAPAP